jgi:hypothetical protein
MANIMEQQPQQMELIGPIESTGLIGTGITLASLDQAGHGMMSLDKLTLANGNSTYEVVDALSFFGKKDKTPEGAGSSEAEMKNDDGDSKGFW